MLHRSDLDMSALTVASGSLATAVGCSYVYVDLSLNRMGASGVVIGLNASMPALAWLLGTPLMPWFLRRFDPKRGLLFLLLVAMASSTVFPLTDDLDVWMAARFLFGGACGLVFRLVEYWINAASPDTRRTRDFAIYAVAFCAGAALGSGVAPVWGLEGWPPVVMMLGLVSASFLIFAFASGGGPPAVASVADAPPPLMNIVRRGGLLAMLGALIYGMFEPAPYTLMPVYAVRSGLSEAEGALTASAFLLGQVLFLIPLGMLTDHFGKRAMLGLCVVGAVLIGLTIPVVTGHVAALLAAMILWGACAGSLYMITLALLGELFSGAELATANAGFGTLYALGSLVGPPLHGLAMDWMNPDGLIVSATALLAVFFVVGVASLPFLRSARVRA